MAQAVEIAITGNMPNPDGNKPLREQFGEALRGNLNELDTSLGLATFAVLTLGRGGKFTEKHKDLVRAVGNVEYIGLFALAGFVSLLSPEPATKSVTVAAGLALLVTPGFRRSANKIVDEAQNRDRHPLSS